MAAELGLTYKQVRGAVSRLVDFGALSKKTKNDGILLICNNYEMYQGQAEGTQGATEGQTKGTRRATNNNDKQYNNENNANKRRRAGKANKKLKSPPTFDIEEIQRDCDINDDYDI